MISTRRADAKLQPLSLNVLFSCNYWLSLILHQLPDALFCIIPELINRLNELGETAPGSLLYFIHNKLRVKKIKPLVDFR